MSSQRLKEKAKELKSESAAGWQAWVFSAVDSSINTTSITLFVVELVNVAMASLTSA